jgi:hypothetical protein
MRTLAAFLVALLSTVATAQIDPGGTGPFTGEVRQGQTNVHYYNNNPNNDPCPDVIAWYLVELTYAPASDTLTLSAGGETAVGYNGYAAVAFESGYCTAFAIYVHGTYVQTVARYVATVTRHLGGAPA